MKRKERQGFDTYERDSSQAGSVSDERDIERKKLQEQQQKIKDLEAREKKNTHRLLLLKEKQAQLELQCQKEWGAKEKVRREKEEFVLRKEMEERKKKEKEEEEKQRKDDEHKERVKKAQEKLLKEATKNERVRFGDGDWHNPVGPTGKSVEREKCAFYMKVGSCRFGERCTREHCIPDSSTTIMIPGFYAHFLQDQGLQDEFDSDNGPENEESEQYQHFLEFFEDVVPEFRAHGKVVQFKVCANFEPHLRGNVYVQFSTEKEAYSALSKFNGRWYAGKQLNCQLSVVETWRRAICGEYNQNRCPKGKACNFIHAFRNPKNEFVQADRDHQPSPLHRRKRSSRSPDGQRHHRKRSSSDTPERWRSPSRSPSNPKQKLLRRKHSSSCERSRSPEEHPMKTSPKAMCSKWATPARRSRSPNYKSRRSPHNRRSDRANHQKSRRSSHSPHHETLSWSRTGSSRSRSRDRKHSRSPGTAKYEGSRNSSQQTDVEKKCLRSHEKETSPVSEKPLQKKDVDTPNNSEPNRMSWTDFQKANAITSYAKLQAEQRAKSCDAYLKNARLAHWNYASRIVQQPVSENEEEDT